VEVSFPAIEQASGKVETLYGPPGGLISGHDGWKVVLPGVSAGIYRI
jgi:hypothetical protein